MNRIDSHYPDKVKGVFFDLYGTLLTYGDMSKAWSNWLDSFYTQLLPWGLAESRKEFAAALDGFFSKQAPKVDNKSLTVFEHRIKNLCNDLNLAVANEGIKTIADSSAAIWQKEIHPAPHAEMVLKELKKTKCLGLITNFDHPPHVYELIAKVGFKSLFDVIIISGEVEMKKPDPRIFQLALKKTELTPDRVVYVGDTQEDVAGAKAASITPILIKRRTPVKNGYAYDFDLKEGKRAADPARCHGAWQGVCIIESLRELKDRVI